MTYQGFASLQSPKDLFSKLERDFRALKGDPNNADLAFNFFVTALHLLDWVYPEDGARQKTEEKNAVLLQICSHIANGAKHFKATNGKHQSVSDVKPGGLLFDSQYHPNGGLIFDDPRSGLVVELNGVARELYGDRISTTELSSFIIDFWRAKIFPDIPSGAHEHAT